MANVIDIEGIGKIYAERLHKAGIATTDALLTEGATPDGRKALEGKTGIGHKLILKWVNRADLFRIKGVAEQYSDLLGAAGVHTVLELAQRTAEHLQQKLAETNESKKLVRVVPSLNEVAAWIQEAQQLPRAVKY